MMREEIKDLLHNHPFEPFSIRATSGEEYEVRDSALAALLKSAIFIAFPNSDKRVLVSFLHVAAVEILGGRHRIAAKRRRR